MSVALAELRYVVPGRPVTWQRTYNVRTGRTANREVYMAVQRAKVAHARHFAAARAGRPWPLDGAFEVEVVGYWPSAVVGDSDRLPGCAMDALEGFAYVADRQVRDQTGRVRVDRDEPRVEVVVRRLEVDPVAKRRAK